MNTFRRLCFLHAILNLIAIKGSKGCDYASTGAAEVNICSDMTITGNDVLITDKFVPENREVACTCDMFTTLGVQLDMQYDGPADINCDMEITLVNLVFGCNDGFTRIAIPSYNKLVFRKETSTKNPSWCLKFSSDRSKENLTIRCYKHTLSPLSSTTALPGEEESQQQNSTSRASTQPAISTTNRIISSTQKTTATRLSVIPSTTPSPISTYPHTYISSTITASTPVATNFSRSQTSSTSTQFQRTTTSTEGTTYSTTPTIFRSTFTATDTNITTNEPTPNTRVNGASNMPLLNTSTSASVPTSTDSTAEGSFPLFVVMLIPASVAVLLVLVTFTVVIVCKNRDVKPTKATLYAPTVDPKRLSYIDAYDPRNKMHGGVYPADMNLINQNERNGLASLHQGQNENNACQKQSQSNGLPNRNFPSSNVDNPCTSRLAKEQHSETIVYNMVNENANIQIMQSPDKLHGNEQQSANPYKIVNVVNMGYKSNHSMSNKASLNRGQRGGNKRPDERLQTIYNNDRKRQRFPKRKRTLHDQENKQNQSTFRNRSLLSASEGMSSANVTVVPHSGDIYAIVQKPSKTCQIPTQRPRLVSFQGEDHGGKDLSNLKGILKHPQ